jgi:predicted ATPase
LIDALYEHKVKLFVTADAAPEDLYEEAMAGSNSTARSAA